MLKQKKIINLVTMILSTVLLILLILGIMQCYKVNKKYPSPTVMAVDISQELLINDNNLKVKATEFEVKEIDDLLPDHSIPFNYNANSKIAIVKLNVKNVSDNNESFDLTSLVLTTNGWKNGLFLDLFMKLNPDYYSVINPDESIDIIVPYAMLDYQFEKSIWEKINEQHFRIVFQVYPENKYINLNAYNQ